MKRMELWFSVILIGLGIAGLIYSFSLPLMGPVALCPGLFPGFVTAMMVILGAGRLIQLYRDKSVVTEPDADGEDDADDGKRNIFVILAFFLLYLLLLVYVRFLTSTVLFLFGSMLFLYKKFYWKIPVISVLTTLGVFYLFRYLLNVRLP
jgi:putative tricarboxylic transport membrane protein